MKLLLTFLKINTNYIKIVKMSKFFLEPINELFFS